MSIRYTKSPVPTKPEDLPSYLQSELSKISEVISNIADGHMDVTYVAPEKPRDGDIRYADGTSWNPSHGKALYYYDGDDGHWHKLNFAHS